jgi:hypothetical protein
MTIFEEKFVRVRHWFLAAIILMTLGILYMGLAPAAEAPLPPTDAALKSWVHIFGCPASTKRKRGPEHLVLIFSDGASLILRLDTADEEHRQKLTEAVGDVRGTTITYECGVSS